MDDYVDENIPAGSDFSVIDDEKCVCKRCPYFT